MIVLLITASVLCVCTPMLLYAFIHRRRWVAFLVGTIGALLDTIYLAETDSGPAAVSLFAALTVSGMLLLAYSLVDR